MRNGAARGSACSACAIRDLASPGLHILRYMCYRRCRRGPRMTEQPSPQKIPGIFPDGCRERAVHEWLKALPEVERRMVGKDLLRHNGAGRWVCRLCRPMGTGVWEIRTDLPTKRTA